jgi:ATP-dependent Clp protease ATP-binding subunit ClpC
MSAPRRNPTSSSTSSSPPTDLTEQFTDRARQALSRAREEARALRHSFVGTEHILLALLRDDAGPAVESLQRAGVTHGHVRTAVVRMMGTGVEEPADEELVFTGRAQDAIELARRAASEAGRDLADTDHILLALVREHDGAAVRILLQLDADPAAIRATLSS